MRYALCLLLVGCGQAASAKLPNPASRPTLGDESCAAPYLAGAKYSPGGTVLPHTCKAFDAVTNNPYAVRCVDALSNYKSGWAGDEFCILPPPPDKGVQVGAHPQGDSYWDKMYAGDLSGYADPMLTKPFEVAPATELVQNFDTPPVTPQDQNFFRIDLRMRPGSHHIATWYSATAGTVGWEPLVANPSLGFGNTTFINAQSTHSDRPAAIDLASEDQGLGVPFPANTSVSIQLHHINPDATTVLREVWINVWWLPSGQSFTPVTQNPLNAPIDYPPNQVTDNVNTAVAMGDVRILSIFGHRHAWTSRFSGQILRADGTTEEMYDSFNWREIPTYELDSLTKNPQLDVAKQLDGSISGMTVLHQGDKIQFDCHVDTTATHASELGVDPPTSNLHFSNEAFGGEMCIFYVESTGATLKMQ